MSADEYYDELYASPHAHRRAGWRYRLEQLWRFEIALAALERSGPIEELLDIGCGPALLYDYMSATGRGAARYRGVDRLVAAIEDARARLPPEAELSVADVDRGTLRGADAAVAIGALVGGAESALARAKACAWSAPRGVLIALRAEAIAQNASLSIDPALRGLSARALGALREELAANDVSSWIDDETLSSECILCWWPRRARRAPRAGSLQEACRGAAARVLDASGLALDAPADIARLAIEAGLIARAAVTIDAMGSGEEKAILRERLRARARTIGGE